jgi:hypothetical protein
LQGNEEALEAALREFDIRRLRRARALRRTFFLVLAVFVLAGAANVLGGRSGTATARGGGYELRVSYARVSRPGHDADWELEVRRPGGFDGPIRLATDSSYLDVFDQSSVRPEPQSVTTDDERIIWEFAPPAGETLDVELDAQVGQDSMGMHKGATAVLGPRGEVVGVTYGTAVLP